MTSKLLCFSHFGDLQNSAKLGNRLDLKHCIRKISLTAHTFGFLKVWNSNGKISISFNNSPAKSTSFEKNFKSLEYYNFQHTFNENASFLKWNKADVSSLVKKILIRIVLKIMKSWNRNVAVTFWWSFWRWFFVGRRCWMIFRMLMMMMVRIRMNLALLESLTDFDKLFLLKNGNELSLDGSVLYHVFVCRQLLFCLVRM